MVIVLKGSKEPVYFRLKSRISHLKENKMSNKTYERPYSDGVYQFCSIFFIQNQVYSKFSCHATLLYLRWNVYSLKDVYKASHKFCEIKCEIYIFYFDLINRRKDIASKVSYAPLK